jgi:hypothetical protein
LHVVLETDAFGDDDLDARGFPAAEQVARAEGGGVGLEGVATGAEAEGARDEQANQDRCESTPFDA